MDQMDQTSTESVTTESGSQESSQQNDTSPASAGNGFADHIAKVSAGKAASPAGALTPTEEAAVIAEYAPNFKYKAAGGEQEFDEFIRGAIKNAEHEKKIRELYEKAGGLDHVKAERERFRNDYKSVNEQHQTLNKGLDHLSTMLRNKDYHGFFESLKVPEQDVLQYALSRVQYKEMPPEQRQQLDQQYAVQQEAETLRMANEELVAAYQGQMVQQRTSELEGYIGRPEVAQVAQGFDARVGRPGAFREEVIKRGQYYASLPEPQDITVEQAVREIMSLIGAQNAHQAQVPQDQEPVQQAESPQAFSQQQKPVIPNIKGRGTSPAQKVIRSIDDLRKLSNSMP